MSDKLTDDMTLSGINDALGSLGNSVKVHYYDTIGSTNTELKAAAESGASEGTVYVASAQNCGRGRLGRTFFSPRGTGIYLSVLLRPALDVKEAAYITPAAAVAVSGAIERVCGIKTEVKWVNDILYNGKKVCGILTEAKTDPISGKLLYTVMGAGINLYEPAGGFPKEISDIAGSLLNEHRKGLKNRLCAEIIKDYIHLSGAGDTVELLQKYRSLCTFVGHGIYVIKGGVPVSATAVSIQNDYKLKVMYDDGSTETLDSGEISIKMKV